MSEALRPKVRGQFADLAPRVGTAAFLMGIGVVAVWGGTLTFALLISVCVAVMLWELATMLGAGRRSLALGGLGGGAVLAASLLPLGIGLPLLMAVPMAGIALMRVHRRIFLGFAVAIVLAGVSLTVHMTDFGWRAMLWLVLVVVASDVMGYFAGRMLGGPKFWPKVSPKKTWSGTVAGWVGAAIVGVIWVVWLGGGVQLIGISVALAMMAQMGDIAESAVKRKMGVKDSSNLLPGHGGLFDRFDAMLGAALLLLVIESFGALPLPMAADVVVVTR
ncbi:phosphatidate cytidylyltransferase [Jannaschia sp. Os4]|uniref:phosphatidate cytidylyltransferase n=1 Tax=Jannaschia sp. Os4 TaxID=2807617 RepID=UPI00193A3B8B|nr:phosphatidate cytidylyltransferase [Jannaschia sp. Os4]